MKLFPFPLLRKLPLRWHLVFLVVGALLPVAAFSTMVVVRVATQQQEASHRRLTYSARLMAEAVDREISSTIRILEALAQDESLDTGDLKRFWAASRRTHRSQPSWLSVLLVAPDGRQLVASTRPWGTPLPRSVADPESLQAVLRTGRPSVGRLARGKKGGRWAFPVRVPVRRDGQIRYVLTAAIPPQALADVVARQLPPQEEWTRTITDQHGVVVARTREPERFVGRLGTPAFLKRIREQRDGVFRNQAIDGVTVYAAFYRTPLADWTAVVTTPVEAVDGPVRDSVLTMLGAGALLLLLSGAGAYRLSRQVSRGISSAAAAASALAHGGTPEMPPSSVREVDQLREALSRSAELLLTRERERDELLARAEAARGEAERANRSKDEFLAMLGHELRNPLSPIVTALELMRRRGQSDTREWEIINRQARHLGALVEDLLDVSRITRGKIELRRAPVELAVVVARAVETAAPLIDQFQHHLTVEVPESGLTVDGDLLRLTQVVTNLLTNAARYTPPGGEIRVEARRDHEWVELRVIDNGAGLTPELLARVFEVFEQGPRALARQEGGLGLGLSIVRSLVLLHEGQVDATSDGPGRGSTFRVRLPVQG
ncbi:MAG: Chemotaxis protein methyltransferase CheR [Armatimonadetes bacterium]|jgi:signal transduction histidine kinase|nr:Chemotaxis protein methyltransferase CheR [Armatimonadota bacterium]